MIRFGILILTARIIIRQLYLSEKTFIVIQIEDPKALEHAEAMAAVRAAFTAAAPGSDEHRSARMLLDWLVGSEVGRQLAAVEEREIAWERHASITLPDGSAEPYQRAPITIANTTDAAARNALDDARAAVTWDRMSPTSSFADYLKWLEHQVELINHSLKGVPEDRVRYHVCWGSWPGPHVTDVALRDIVHIVLKIKAQAFVIEGANPRHEHEWKVWKDVKLPAGKLLIPGVISHATNIVEHPELVAQRLVRLANIVGRDNVLGGTDCGFAQSPFAQRVHPSIMWAKLRSLSEGARIASKELWGK